MRPVLLMQIDRRTLCFITNFRYGKAMSSAIDFFWHGNNFPTDVVCLFVCGTSVIESVVPLFY